MNFESSFERADGRKSVPLSIEVQNKIGGGNFGDVHEVTAHLEGQSQRFVLKRFKANEYGSAAAHAQNALENYRQAKAAGLKVFGTYRLGEDGESILMTDPRRQGEVCVGANNDGSNSLAHFGEPLLEPIESFKDFARKIFQEGAKAAQKGFCIPNDSLFFVVGVHRNPSPSLDFFLGDLDGLSSQPHLTDLYQTNLRNMQEMLGVFIENNVAPQHREAFAAMVREVYTEFERVEKTSP